MANEGILAATVRDIPWLPPGSYAEVWLGDAPAPPGLCTSAFALAFDDDMRLLLTTVRKRGLDIPGGHVETTDESPEAAAVREAAEETGAAIRIVGKAGHLRLVVPSPPAGYRYPSVSFQPFYAAVIDAMGPVQMPEECADPTFADPNEAASNPRFALHNAFILAAAEMVRCLRPTLAGIRH